ncbi:MAG TPA: DUF2017 domain-containing protein [Mycobacteriales bacterium]|nr:DUF2017 domain-containing protein [Mycobacteriales bacterium]
MGKVRRRGGAIRVDLEAAEIVLLASLVSQVRDLLVADLTDADAGGDSADPLAAIVGLPAGPASRPDDPVLARLLPDAYREDGEASDEYRRLMEGDLRAQKAGALQRVLDDLSGTGVRHGDGQRFELADEAVTPWLYALTDVRLALGTRLDVSEDVEADLAALEPGSPELAAFAVYDWLGWLQNAVVEAAS